MLEYHDDMQSKEKWTSHMNTEKSTIWLLGLYSSYEQWTVHFSHIFFSINMMWLASDIQFYFVQNSNSSLSKIKQCNGVRHPKGQYSTAKLCDIRPQGGLRWYYTGTGVILHAMVNIPDTADRTISYILNLIWASCNTTLYLIKKSILYSLKAVAAQCIECE